jgi:hypothetical protein
MGQCSGMTLRRAPGIGHDRGGNRFRPAVKKRCRRRVTVNRWTLPSRVCGMGSQRGNEHG